MPSIAGPITECPKCGGPVWDNRKNKRSAKGPDFKCKDRDCGEAFWLKRDTTASTPGPTNGRGPKWTWPQLSKMYQRSLLVAEKHLAASNHRTAAPFTPSDILSATATIFIAATRDGVEDPTPKKQTEPVSAPAEDGDDFPY